MSTHEHDEKSAAQTSGLDALRTNAKFAADKEQSMTLWQGIRLYPKAVAWSILISTCIAMEGYQVCLLRCVPSHTLARMCFLNYTWVVTSMLLTRLSASSVSNCQTDRTKLQHRGNQG
jgi:hypothetical protein